MMSSANRLLQKKIKVDSYMRSTFILAIDMIVSLIASAVVILFAYLLNLGGTSSVQFASTWIIGAFIGSLLAFLITQSYQGIIRHSTLRELATLCEATIAKEIIMIAIAAMFISSSLPSHVFWVLPAIDFLVTLTFLIIVRISMVLAYDFIVSTLGGGEVKYRAADRIKRVLVYGIGEKAVSLSTRFQKSSQFRIVGYLTRKDASHPKTLNGKPIYQFDNIEELLRLKDQHGINGIMFPNPADAKREENDLVDYARHLKLKLYVAPSIDEIKEGKALINGIRDIKIEDLLGREVIDISLEEVKRDLNGKTVLVTGAAGSIGSELCRQLAQLGIARLIMVDNAETPLHNLRLEFEDKFKWVQFVPVIGDVRAEPRMDFVFRDYRPDIVFHAAAYKHVPLMEENPCEAVMVNVAGSRIVADKCIEYGVEKMVMVSTDKAVNPTNIMGCTKRLAEIYVQSLGLSLNEGNEGEVKTKFVTTRFGNVLGSNGSVIPRFKEQIAAGGPVTVTHPEIRRFFMTIPEACRLVLEASTIACGTHIYAFDMGSPVKIADLAARMINLAGYEVDRDIKIVYSGLRPGEKLYEEVLADKENTVPTSHKRIFQARVREYDYEGIRENVNTLIRLAQEVEIREMVRLMKQIVPEFISNHSQFEELDNVQNN